MKAEPTPTTATKATNKIRETKATKKKREIKVIKKKRETRVTRQIKETRETSNRKATRVTRQRRATRVEMARRQARTVQASRWLLPRRRRHTVTTWSATTEVIHSYHHYTTLPYKLIHSIQTSSSIMPS